MQTKEIDRLPHEDILFYPSCEGEYQPIENIDDIIGKLQSQQQNFLFYKTRSQREIFNLLWTQAITLSRGKYINSQGEHSSTLVGARGIGKSATLKIFASSIHILIPKIIRVYVNFNNICSEGNQLAKVSLSKIIEERLLLHYGTLLEIQATPFPKPLAESIIDMLDKLNLHLQLFIDEMDQMYQIDGKKFPSVVTTLSDLSYFGNQPSGRMSIIICGSSAFMENLITTNAPDSVTKKFVLLSTGAINLNDNKFITKRVYSSLPCDLESVASITQEALTEDSKPWLRLVAFCTGCTARNVGRILKEGDTVNVINRLACPKIGEDDNEEHVLLWREIMKLLAEKNRKLLKTLFSQESFDCTIAAISTSNWEETFAPLNFLEVQSNWKKLLRKNNINDEMYRNLSHNILHLADQNGIAFGGVRHGRPDQIFPFTLLSLCNYYVESKNRGSQYAEKFRQTIANGLELARNPRVYAAGIRAVGSVTAASIIFCCLIM